MIGGDIYNTDSQIGGSKDAKGLPMPGKKERGLNFQRHAGMLSRNSCNCKS